MTGRDGEDDQTTLPLLDRSVPQVGAEHPSPTSEGHSRFEILSRLGSGGMGEVYRVRDRELDEVVALKLLPPDSTDDSSSIERLKREVKLARRIVSDRVCRIFDLVDLGDGRRGLTMAFISGKTIGQMKDTLRVDYARFCRWGLDIAEGLQAAHRLGIIHRDLKPENIMITDDDRAIILDFGIARGLMADAKDTKVTRAGVLIGTPLYMSPEQLSDAPLDGRSDLYALGLILAELSTGDVPSSGPSYREILYRRVVKPERYDLALDDPNAPPSFVAIVGRLLEPVPANRFGSAGEVISALQATGLDRLRLESRSSSAPVLAFDTTSKGDLLGRVSSEGYSVFERTIKERKTRRNTLLWALVIVAELMALGLLAHSVLRPKTTHAPPSSDSEKKDQAAPSQAHTEKDPRPPPTREPSSEPRSRDPKTLDVPTHEKMKRPERRHPVLPPMIDM